MKAADLTLNRRRFLLTIVAGVAAVASGIVLGEAVWEELDRLGPRRLLVAGTEKINFVVDNYGIRWITQHDDTMASHREAYRMTSRPLNETIDSYVTPAEAESYFLKTQARLMADEVDRYILNKYEKLLDAGIIKHPGSNLVTIVS